MPAASRIYYSSHSGPPGSEITNSDQTNWTQIDILSIQLSEDLRGDLLATLTVPDTWNTATGCGAFYRIVLQAVWPDRQDEEELAIGLFSVAQANQRIPFSLVGYKHVLGGGITPPPSLRLAVYWRAWQGGTAYIGAMEKTSLSVIYIAS